jgi:hypothetical protein
MQTPDSPKSGLSQESQVKVNEYVERIRKGEDRNSILDNAGPFRVPVEEALKKIEGALSVESKAKVDEYVSRILSGEDKTLILDNAGPFRAPVEKELARIEKEAGLIESGTSEDFEQSKDSSIERLAKEVQVLEDEQRIQELREQLDQPDASAKKQEVIGALKEKRQQQEDLEKTESTSSVGVEKNQDEEVQKGAEASSDAQKKLREYLLSKVDTRFTKEVSRKVARDNLEKADDTELYKIALEQFYQEARVGEYDRTNPLFDLDVEELTKEPNPLIKRVQDENGWHYRIPTTSTTANKSENRLSLNVWGNKELVNRLDALANKYGIYYKTPSQSDSWNERNDPVTIYINNPNLTPEQTEALKQEVVNMTKEFVRSNEGFGIYGDNISPGVEFGPESTVAEIHRLKNEAAAISPELREAFNQYLWRDGKEKSSVGMNLAAQTLLNLFKKDQKRVLPNEETFLEATGPETGLATPNTVESVKEDILVPGEKAKEVVSGVPNQEYQQEFFQEAVSAVEESIEAPLPVSSEEVVPEKVPSEVVTEDVQSVSVPVETIPVTPEAIESVKEENPVSEEAIQESVSEEPEDVSPEEEQDTEQDHEKEQRLEAAIEFASGPLAREFFNLTDSVQRWIRVTEDDSLFSRNMLAELGDVAALFHKIDPDNLQVLDNQIDALRQSLEHGSYDPDYIMRGVPDKREALRIIQNIEEEIVVLEKYLREYQGALPEIASESQHGLMDSRVDSLLFNLKKKRDEIDEVIGLLRR